MEIELEAPSRFENIKSNAYWSKVGIDTRLTVDNTDFDRYGEHLKDCINHPTTGMLAHHKYINGKVMNYPFCARHNLNLLEKLPEIKNLQKSLKNKIKTLYPKTKHIRDYIINNERVVLDYIEPAKKYTTFDKFKILMKKFV